MSAKTISSCPTCSYPLTFDYAGQIATCAYCGEEIEGIAQEDGQEDGVTIPTPLFVGLIAFGLGMFLGPALVASTEGGKRWLEEQARSRGG